MSVPTPEQMQQYVETARRRDQERRSRLEHEREKALAVAQEASHLLKSEFGVSRVVLFGSVLSDSTFHENSDVDLAVWDLAEANYLKALGKLLNLSEFSIDLVMAETANDYIRDAISQGLPL
jgi:predicted nucleotidyltransferase